MERITTFLFIGDVQEVNPVGLSLFHLHLIQNFLILALQKVR